MDTKVIKTLKFSSEEQYQINAVKLEGYSAQELRESVTTDDIQVGDELWIFECGSATKNI